MTAPEAKGAREDTAFEIRFYEGILTRSPDFVDALFPLAELYTRTGLYEKGLETDQKLAKLCPRDSGVFYNLACSLALTGSKNSALETLEKAVDLGYCDGDHMKNDPDLKSLHGEDAFQALLKRLRA